MAQAIVMPKMGQTVEEASIVKWHKKEGDLVNKGDVIFEIETDKAVLEVESFFEGTLLKVFTGEGETVPVNSTVAFLGKPGEEVPAQPEMPVAKAPKTEAPKAEGEKKERVERPTSNAQRPTPKEAKQPGTKNEAQRTAAPLPARLFISPRAKTLARESVIDPAKIVGTGPNGRIVVKDVRSYLDQNGYYQLKITPAAKRLAAKEEIDVLTVRPAGGGQRISVRDVEGAVAMKPKKMSKRRQIIAQRLTESFTTTPHFYVSVSADMTDLLAYRKELKEQGQVYTVTDFILESVILSLQEYQGVNSTTDGTHVRWHGPVQLGMAVGLEEGLVVPVIRDAEELTMRELHDTAKSLAEKARTGSLLPDQMTGSTFTVSNMGMMDVDNFNAIINPGEGAILAVASTRPTAVPVDGEVQIRAIMKMTLSVDHRIVDGKMAAEFINATKHKLEDVELWKSLT